MNVVAPAGERPAALLIRAAKPLEGLDSMAQFRGLSERYDGNMTRTVKENLASGPGKLCQALQVDLSFNFHELDEGKLQIQRGLSPNAHAELPVQTTPRIGLNPDTVGEAVEWPWRYVVSGSRFLSR